MKFGENNLFNTNQTAKGEQQDSTTTSQIRELYSMVGTLRNDVNEVQTQVTSTLLTETPTSDTAPPMVNFVDNSDFTLSHYAYSLANDITTNYILAKWYSRPQDGTGPYLFNDSAAESPTSVRSGEGYGVSLEITGFTADTLTIDNDPVVLGDGMPVTVSGVTGLTSGTVYYVVNATTTGVQLATLTGGTPINTITGIATPPSVSSISTAFDPYKDDRITVWDTETATLAMSGGQVVASPLTSKYVFLGNLIYVKMTLAHKPREFESSSITRSSNILTYANHGLVDGTLVFFVKNSSSSSLPSPITDTNQYFIKSSTDNTFQLSQTDGGPTLTLTTDGNDYVMKTRIKAGLAARVSLFENNGAEIFKGDKPVIRTSKIGTHTGNVTRKYILEVQMPTGKRFYSDLNPAGITGTNNPSTVDGTNYVSVSWDKIVGASRYNVYRSSNGGTTWYLIGTTTSNNNLLFDYGGGTLQFIPPTFGNSPMDTQLEYHKAESIIENVSDVVRSGELVAAELNSSIIFPSAITDFAAKGDQIVQIEFFRANGDATTLADIPKNSLLIDKVSLSYVYGRWHPSARDQALTPIKLVPTAGIAVGGVGDGTGSSSGGGSGSIIIGDKTQCVHLETPILCWSDNGEHYWMAAKDIVLGDRLVSWNGTELVPSRVSRITNGISKMNYKIFAEDFEVVCSFSHRIIANMADFPKGTNAGRLDDRVVVYDAGNVREAAIEGIESFSSPMRVVTFKMEKGLENYVSGGIFSHNNKDSYELNGTVVV